MSTTTLTNKNSIIEDMRKLMKRLGYSIHTENAYCDWVVRYIRYSKFSSRDSLMLNAESNVELYLTFLATEKNVAASTQNQALNALVFLYSKLLNQPLKNVSARRSRKEPRIPVVLSTTEVKNVLTLLNGASALITSLMYAGGLRISEAIRLRIQDIDFDYKQITVRDGKGNKDRVTPLANNLIPLLQQQINKVEVIHNNDLSLGLGVVYLPFALGKKYPNAAKELGWQYVFPSRNLSVDPRSNVKRRHHLDQSVINKAIKRAVKTLGINKRVSAHTFRHCFATHLLQSGTDIRTIQSLLGHADLQTTMIYTHVIKQGGHGVISPFDEL